MAEIETPNIPVNLLGFNPSYRNARAYREGIEFIFSEDGLAAYHAYTKGRKPRVDLEAIDSHALRILGMVHGFPQDTSQRELRRHWGEALNKAYSLVEYAAKTAIHPSFNFPGQDTDLYDRPTKPSDILREMANDEDKIFQFETRRQVALAFVLGDFIAFKDNARLRDRNGEIGRLLRSQIFLNNGSKYGFDKFGYFNPATNEVVGFDKNEIPPRPDLDVKRIVRWARAIWDVGLVHYTPRIKDPLRSAIKALIKSRDAGGFVQTFEQVSDNFGTKIVVLEGGDEEVDVVVTRVEEAIAKKYPGVEIKEDNFVGSDREQSSLIRFKRRQFTFKDLPGIPYELMVRTLRDELIDQYMHGYFDPDKGYHTGPAHRLHELRNIAKVFDILFPEEVYGVNKKAAIRTQSLAIAEELRRDQTIHFGQLPAISPGYRFVEGDYLLTRRGDSQTGVYKIEGLDGAKRALRLSRPDGSTFRADPLRITQRGMIGDEELLGTSQTPPPSFHKVS